MSPAEQQRKSDFIHELFQRHDPTYYDVVTRTAGQRKRASLS
jgi:hypothetical protein